MYIILYNKYIAYKENNMKSSLYTVYRKKKNIYIYMYAYGHDNLRRRYTCRERFTLWIL